MTRMGWQLVIGTCLVFVAIVLGVGLAIRRSEADTCHKNIVAIVSAELKLGAKFGGYTEDVAAFGLPASCPSDVSARYAVERSPYGVLNVTCPNANTHATTTGGHSEEYQVVLMAPSIYSTAKP